MGTLYFQRRYAFSIPSCSGLLRKAIGFHHKKLSAVFVLVAFASNMMKAPDNVKQYLWCLLAARYPFQSIEMGTWQPGGTIVFYAVNRFQHI